MYKFETQSTVLITGATGRLGSAFSHRIVEAGGQVFLVDLNQSKGEELSKKLGKEKGRKTGIKHDFIKTRSSDRKGK